MAGKAKVLFRVLISFGPALLPLGASNAAPSKDKSRAKGAKAAIPFPAAPSRFTPLVYDDQEPAALNPLKTGPSFRYLGASRLQSAASPYVDVRVGIPETPGGNNHMRRQVASSPSSTVHMVYGVVNADSTESAIDFSYYYNAYDCGNSNALRNASLDVPLIDSGPPADSRLRYMFTGGLFIPPGLSVPVVYGNRIILGDGLQGCATIKDAAECLGLFSMDTTMSDSTSHRNPVTYPLNESTWVATYQVGNIPQRIDFNYTTDRGLTWSAFQTLPTYSPWYNSTDITGRGNTFYIVSVADPNDPNAFMTTERPCYLKGTYDPSTGAVSFGTMTDITGNFELPGYLANFIDISALMVGDTLHVLWTDWNNYLGLGGPGPGGHVHHAAVLPDGTVLGPNKVADINIDGRLPDRSYTLFGFAEDPWAEVSLSYDSTRGYFYALWSQPPDNGAYGWADYEQYGELACYDIFMGVSPNNGRAWDSPRNVTQTNNPGCNGVSTPCYHEDYFAAAQQVVNDTVWVVAMVQRYPGFQETAIRRGITPDPGPLTEQYDVFRLYKVPAGLAPPCGGHGALLVPPGDTTKLYELQLKPRGGTFTTPIRLTNFGCVDLYLDSVTLGPGLNDGFLVTTTNASPGTLVPAGEFYDFSLSLNTDGVGSANIGLRSGLLRAYVHTVSPPLVDVIPENISVYVVPTLCFNRKITIHSATNRTDVGIQGSIKDQGGNGMYYFSDGSDRFYDGGVAFANSGLNAPGCASGPRKVTRQLFSDKFLRCVADGILDSVPGTGGGYYNLFLKSIGTDVNDTTLVWENIWEQSTHPDSSDFLLQTTRVINIGNAPIDSLAMGVLYDVDVVGQSSASENVSGDTTLTDAGRTFWLGWIGCNDVAVDTCSPAADMYGAVVIPGSIGNPGDFVRPRAQIMYEQRGFSYNIACGNPSGGDTLAQRYFWKANVLTSARDRQYDTLTGAWTDTLSPPYSVCNSDKNNGPPYRTDMGYMAVARLVHGFPVNGGGSGAVARYGLDGLAASVDTLFSGPGETYTVIHVGSVSGLADLMAHAIKGIDWYANHANLQVGVRQTRFRGDLNNDGHLSPSDVVLELNYVFLNIDVYAGNAIPVCVGDLNNDGDLSPADVVLLLNGTFLGGECPGCMRPCI